MAAKDALFELIKSLSPAEKRYFKLEISKYSSSKQNDYQRLYELMDKEEQYDEKTFKRKLKGDPLLKRFSGIKNYLYNLLLKVLVQMHKDRNVFAKLHYSLEEISILYDRQMYKQASKKVRQAIKLAEECQKYDYLLVLNRWALRLSEFEETHEKSMKNIHSFLDDKKRVLAELELEMEIEVLYETIETYKRGMARTEEEKAYYQSFLNSPVLSRAQQSDSVYIQSMAWGLVDICSFMSAAPKTEIYQIGLKRKAVFDGLSATTLKEFAYYYCASCFDFLQVLLSLKKYDEFVSTLAEVKSYWEENGDYFDGFTQNVFYLTVNYFSTKFPRLIGDFDQIVQLGYELKDDLLNRIDKGGHDRAMFIIPLNIAFAYFVKEDYEEALFWWRVVLNDTKNTIRPDVLGIAHICHLLTQYELGNRSILDYQVDRAQRFLSTKSKLYDFEKSFLSFFRRVRTLSHWDSEYEKAFLKLKSQLQELVDKGAFEKSYIQDLYFIQWVESKLNKSSFEEQIQAHLSMVLI
jgi:hypothetical protein